MRLLKFDFHTMFLINLKILKLAVFHILRNTQLSRREICAANFLPPCEKAPPTFNQKSELRVTLKKGYLLQWYTSVGKPIAVKIFT